MRNHKETSLNVMKGIRKGRGSKFVCQLTSFCMLLQMILPYQSYALTSGPGQQEYTSFEPASTSDMVDLNSGDFTYNIPLLSVPGPQGGYPINLAYHSGVGMEQEATWVGLGWTLNMGAITRQLRGLPDDFKKEKIKQKYSTKPGFTGMIDSPLSDIFDPINSEYRELFGIKQNLGSNGLGIGLGVQLYYNNYKGVGYIASAEPKKFKKKFLKNALGLGVNFDSQKGIGINPKIGLQGIFKKQKLKFDLKPKINNRTGLKGISFKTGLSIKNKKDKIKGNGLGNSSLGYASFKDVGQTTIPTINRSFPFKFSLGTDYQNQVPGVYVSRPAVFFEHWTGSFSYSDVINEGKVTSNGYGYLHTPSDPNSGDLLDFSRSHLEYSKKVPNLAPSSYNHDIFTMTGQGTGGMFRAERNNVSILSNRESVAESLSYDVGIEFGSLANPPGYHAGLDYVKDKSVNTSGKWKGDDFSDQNSTPNTINDIRNDIGYQDGKEESYFKIYGEQTGEKVDEDFLKHWKGDNAVKVKLEKTAKWKDKRYYASNTLISSTGQTLSVSDANVRERDSRQKRTTVINKLTAKDAEAYGNSRYVQYYTDTDTNGNYINLQNKNFSASTDVNADHISEFEVIQNNGLRYYYGLPAYNKHQVDASMSVKDDGDFNTKKVAIEADSYKDTKRKYLNKTTLPAYAHSWLLTSVVSDDYIDRTNDGPTDDDFGYWTKFTYQKTSDDYEWRVPYQDANFIEGNKGDKNDNVAYYSYGKKELYYTATVETKTHIAVFRTSPRKDGMEAYGEYSSATGRDDRMYKLDRIDMYAKGEYYDYEGQVNPNAIPLQSVHLEYEYELCKNIPNHQDYNTTTKTGPGKLTLKEVYFTYEKSNRGALSPYKFTYDLNNSFDNPNYELRDMDRWGAFKNNEQQYGTAQQYPSVDFPYTDQEDTNQDAYAAAWALKEIGLPTGGTMKIDYERDDYGYVESKNAMRMFDILGVEQFESGGVNRNDSTPERVKLNKKNPTNDGYRLYFKLEEPIVGASLAQQNELIRTKYVKDIKKLWFKTYTQLKTVNSDIRRDYVEGYANLMISKLANSDYFGTHSSNGTATHDIGFITLQEEPLQENRLGLVKVNPIQKAAIQHLRINRPELIGNLFNGSNTGASIGNFLTSWITFLDDTVGMVAGFNTWAKAKGYGNKITLNGQSILRLHDPDGIKKAGTSRVKRIAMHDNWSEAEGASVYGQEYEYTTEENGEIISSGVAYEPSIGAEESALRAPLASYDASSFLQSEQTMFVEKPLMESYYPSASVSYSKVTVKSIAPEQANSDGVSIKNSVAPINVYEFYTGKDFPIYFDQTEIDKDPAIVRVIPVPGIYMGYKKRKARSQGYSIVMNDMAGKMKRTASYARVIDTGGNDTLGDIINQVEYKYNISASDSKKLDNKVQVLNDDGSYETAVLGETFDVFIDQNENRFKGKGRGVHLNLEFGLIIPFPFIPIPIPLPQGSDTEESLKTIVTNKIIHRSGLLKEVIVTTDQSTISTENLAYDLETGAVLLTKTTNEWDDDVYNYSYPAHWYYDNMGSAYENTQLQYTVPSVGLMTSTSGTISGYLDATKFNKGDKLYLDYYGSVANRVATVVDTNSGLICIDDYGNYIPNGDIQELTVVRSGKRNLQSVHAGELVAKNIAGFDANTVYNTPQSYTLDKIVDAIAVQYSDKWQANCIGCDREGNDTTIEGLAQNPYEIGIKGNWRPFKTYKYLSDRNYNANIREDGIYDDFIRFPWEDIGALTNTSNPNYALFDKWTWSNKVSKISPYGYEIENQDAVGRYSAALYGYKNALAIAVGDNMRYNEMAFDGFEDYPKQCDEDHFNWDPSETYVNASKGVNFTDTQAHTGSHSMRLMPATAIRQERPTGNPADCSEDQLNIITNTSDKFFYEVDDCDCTGTFTPSRRTKYVFGAWVKVGDSVVDEKPTITDVSATLILSNGTAIQVLPSGKVIEGWQRMYKEFEIPAGVASLTIEFRNNSEEQNAYVDDVRMHPFLGNMKSFVYNPINLKMEAELDANNYATFYSYDAEGNLVLVKKETREGIQTIQEGRTSKVRQ